MVGPEEHPAEELLIEKGLISRRSPQRRALLGCLGCRWLRSDGGDGSAEVYGLKLIKCTGINPGTVYPILHALRDKGVMIGVRVPRQETEERVLYRPAQNSLGAAFQASLQIPPKCPLEINSSESAPLDTPDKARPHLQSSSSL